MAVEFHPLTIAEVKPETDDSVSITFDVPAELRQEFHHDAGQHVVVRADIEGSDVRRSYSICTAPDSATLRIGVKRIPDGLFSTYATTKLAAGDVVEVMAPIGEFTATPRSSSGPNGAEQAGGQQAGGQQAGGQQAGGQQAGGQQAGLKHPHHYVMIAAGSGITPILSMISTLLGEEADSQVTLVYGNRTSQTIMFHEDLEGLKNRFPSRFQMMHILSREPNDVALFQGRIDAEKLRLLASGLIQVGDVDDWFLCGPLDMVETATGTLAELGVPSDRLHYELFFDERIESVPEADEATEGLVETQVILDGRTSVVHVDPEGPTLLDYARSVRSEVPFACKGGMCASCKAVVVEGDVVMDKNYALTAEEVEAGYVLTCQSHPRGTDPVTISYDTHGGTGR